MSSRYYPRFVKGNPQLRIFLPDWKMILFKPKIPMPENVVCFKVDYRMTDWDVKNYLEKIYKIPVGAVSSVIRPGKLYKTRNSMAKAEDYRVAHVSLPVGTKFEWPNLFPTEQDEQEKQQMDLVKKEVVKDTPKGDRPPDTPLWFN